MTEGWLILGAFMFGGALLALASRTRIRINQGRE
jgi:hypothetical protein